MDIESRGKKQKCYILTLLQVPGHLETFRSERERSGAFDHHASDSVARTGLFGHGIYQAAKS